MIAWNDPELRVASDSRRTARYRALQGWYRQTVLKVSPGLDRRGRVISSMLAAEDVARNPGLNFLTPQAVDYVAQRTDDVLRGGGTLEKDRLFRNMLSSMPLCFNIFGALRDEPQFPLLFADLFRAPLAQIQRVHVEWAPPKHLHLNDRTAFDAFIEYVNDDGRPAFMAVETKYTEPFSTKRYDSELYQDITRRTELFREGAGTRLVGRATNQLWRMTMLAGSMLERGAYEQGGVAVVSLGEDAHAQAAVDGVRQELADPMFVRFVTLERLVNTARQHASLRAWAEAFNRRYLDLSPIEDHA